MPDESWKKIESMKNELDNQRRQEKLQAEAKKRLEEEKSAAANASRENKKLNDEREYRIAISPIVQKLVDVFENLKQNSPEIKRFPLIEIKKEEDDKGYYFRKITVSLKYGKKDGMTPKEWKYYDKYQMRPAGLERLLVGEPPDEIVYWDYYEIPIAIHLKRVTKGEPAVDLNSPESVIYVGDKISIGDFMKDLSVVYKYIASAMHEASLPNRSSSYHHVYTYRKGIDFWKQSPMDR